LIVSLLFALSAQARTTVIMWHSMAGSLGQILQTIVTQYNQSQNKYFVKAQYKGNYSESLTSAIASFRAHRAPEIVQVFEVGTATMLGSRGAIVPFYQLMQQNHIQLPSKEFMPAIGGYYANSKGQLMALPFNSSSPVLYYNKNAFKKAGLNPNQPPQTWPAMEYAGAALLKAGYQCGFTTAWPSWIQMEVFSAWHNKPFATHNNGLSSLNARVKFNYPLLVKHLTFLAKMQQRKIFQYGGQEDDASALFISNKCPMMMQSSGSLANLKSTVNFPLGIGRLPYWPGKGAPQNTSIGGAALWVLAGHSQLEYQATASFLKFLASPKIEAYWAEQTGYLPVTKAAYAYMKSTGYFKKNPNAEIAIKELNNKPATGYSKGIRLGNYNLIRDINDRAIESILSGQQSAQQALDAAVKQDNLLLAQFYAGIK
jgi:sn-glycerol 3-phosphate transport system substrate-binding protein